MSTQAAIPLIESQGNIWLIDDVVYSDSYYSGAVVHPQSEEQIMFWDLYPEKCNHCQYDPKWRQGGGTGGRNIKINAAILA